VVLKDRSDMKDNLVKEEKGASEEQSCESGNEEDLDQLIEWVECNLTQKESLKEPKQEEGERCLPELVLEDQNDDYLEKFTRKFQRWKLS